MAKWGEIKCANCATLEERWEAACQDAKEAEAYAEELEAKLATCEKYRDAYADCDRIGTQAVRDLEAKLAKAVEAAFYEGFCEGRNGAWVWGDPTPAWKKSDALAELKKQDNGE